MNDKLTEFNVGGTHNENNLGGIPQGIGQNGQLNTVEQGETKKGDFVYSDRLYINEDLVKESNLPGYIKGKSFAEASKAINNKFKDRNDIHSNATKKELLDRLSGAQEFLKSQEQSINESMRANMSTPEYPEQHQMWFGGFTGTGGQPSAGTTGDFSSMASTTQGNPMAGASGGAGGGMGMGTYGQIFGAAGTGLSTYADARDANKRAQAGYYDSKLEQDKQLYAVSDQTKDAVASATGPFGQLFRGIQKAGKGIGDSIGGEAGGAVSGVFSPEEGTISGLTNKNYSVGEKLLSTVPGVGGAMAKREEQRRLNEFKQKRDMFDANAKVSDFAYGGQMFAPYASKNTYAHGGGLTSDDRGSDKKPYPSVNASDFAGGGRSYPIPTKADAVDALRLAGLHGRSDVRAKVFAKYPELKHAYGGNMYAYGGVPDLLNPDMQSPYAPNSGLGNNEVKPFQNWLDQNRPSWLNGSRLNQGQGYGTYGPATKEAFRLYGDEFRRGAEVPNIQNEQQVTTQPNWYDTNKPVGSMDLMNPEVKTQGNNKPGFFSKVGKFTGDNYGNALRYAPLAMNAYQLATLGKPEQETLNRLGNKYIPQYADEKTYTNQINSEMNSTVRALAEASNGSLGNLRANILGAQLNKSKALSDAYSKIADINRNEDRTAQQFNLGVDQANIAQSNLEKDINARNRGAHKTEKSRLLGQMGTDLGNIGKEETWKTQAGKMTGYSYMGNYLNNNPEYKAQFDAIDRDKSLDDNSKYARKAALLKEKFPGMTDEQLKLELANINELNTLNLPKLEEKENKKAYGGYLNPKFKKY